LGGLPRVGTAQGIAEQVRIPTSAFDGSSGNLRTLSGELDLQPGYFINAGPTTPSDDPGAASQPLPRFSGLNTPLIFSQEESVNIADDAIVHGLIDARLGITNKSDTRVAWPVVIFDDLSISGDRNAGNPGNLTVRGNISNSGTLVVGGANLQSQVTGNLRVIGGGLSVTGSSRFLSTLNVDQGFTAGRAGSISNITGRLNLRDGDLWVTDGKTNLRDARIMGEFSTDGTATLNGRTTLNEELTVNNRSTLNGALTLLGAANISGKTDIGGSLTVQNSANFLSSINSQSTIRANEIGRFYNVTGASIHQADTTNWKLMSTASCEAADDILLSCEINYANASNSKPTGGDVYATRIDGTCTVKARKLTAASPNFGNMKAQATCFSPNG